jgi:phosphopantothenoylcysteine decarboxylase/phosphopantothenate--cysteine ligase
VANPDLLADLGRKRAAEQRATPLLVGFAAEVPGAGKADATLEARARAKLKDKGCDVVIANDVGAAGLGFDSDRNAVTLVFASGPALSLGPAAKPVLAEQIWQALLPLVPDVSDEAPTAVRTLRPGKTGGQG